jgi:hypothetical protein
MKVRYVGGGKFYHGIPARDLTDVDWARLNDEQKALVTESPLYEMAKAEAEAEAKTKAKAEAKTKAKEA